MRILKGHTSPETAYVIADYPYGFRLRCKMRCWIEYNDKQGFRFVTQTTNPKVSGEVWNKPKASTYCKFGMAMLLDADGHVQHAGLTEYSNATESQAFKDKYGEGVPEAGRVKLDFWIKAKVAYEVMRNKQAQA